MTDKVHQGRRVALCLYGQPRTMEFCYPSQKKWLLDPLHPDVFICSDSQGDRMRELYHPVAMDITSQEEIWAKLGARRSCYTQHPPGTIPENDLSVCWKLWK